MTYSKDFLALQLVFAQKVAAVKEVPLVDALLEYSNLYKTFQIPGWEFSPQNPVWYEFILKLQAVPKGDELEAIYDFYLTRQSEQPIIEKFGCFWYDLLPEGKIFIHFGSGEKGALSKENMDVRKRELKTMFEAIAKRHPEATQVTGFSWLHNVGAYRRLFPVQYYEHATSDDNWFISLALWGQFLDGNGMLRGDVVQKFLSCIASKDSLEDILNCFPYKVIEPICDIKYFYDFYVI